MSAFIWLIVLVISVLTSILIILKIIWQISFIGKPIVIVLVLIGSLFFGGIVIGGIIYSNKNKVVVVERRDELNKLCEQIGVNINKSRSIKIIGGFQEKDDPELNRSAGKNYYILSFSAKNISDSKEFEYEIWFKNPLGTELSEWTIDKSLRRPRNDYHILTPVPDWIDKEFQQAFADAKKEVK